MIGAIPRRPYAKRLPDLTSGPFSGMHDSLDVSQARPHLARYIQNMIPYHREAGEFSAWIGRPGSVQTHTKDEGERGQCVFQLSKLDGTEIAGKIVEGEIWVHDFGTDTTTLYVSAANFAAASITVSTLDTTRIFAVQFGNDMVFSDGVNVPFMWDGTSGDSGLTELTDCPVLYGQPVVYGARIAGIKNTERNVIVYSEVADATTGYEAGGFNNTAQLRQTAQERLFTLIATNSALYYFRARSIGALYGPLEEFTSTSTTEAISEEIGCSSPIGACLYGDRIFFVDSDARPHAIIIGGGVRGCYEGFQETLGGIGSSPNSLYYAITLYRPDIEAIVFGLPATGSQTVRKWLVVDPDSMGALSVFVIGTLSSTSEFTLAAGIWKDNNSRPRFVTVSTDRAAYVSTLPSTDGNTIGWNDAQSGGAETNNLESQIQHRIEGTPVGVDSKYLKLFDRLDCALYVQERDSGEAINTISIGYQTNAASVFPVTGASALSPQGTEEDERLVIGINAHGRWIVPIIQHTASRQRFGFRQFVVQGHALHADPGAR